MNPTNNLTAEHERLRHFMIGAARTYDCVVDYHLRSWCLKYAIYIRDVRGYGLRNLMPPAVPGPVAVAEANEYAEKIEAIATRIFGEAL